MILVSIPSLFPSLSSLAQSRFIPDFTYQVIRHLFGDIETCDLILQYASTVARVGIHSIHLRHQMISSLSAISSLRMRSPRSGTEIPIAIFVDDFFYFYSCEKLAHPSISLIRLRTTEMINLGSENGKCFALTRTMGNLEVIRRGNRNAPFPCNRTLPTQVYFVRFLHDALEWVAEMQRWIDQCAPTESIVSRNTHVVRNLYDMTRSPVPVD